MTTRDERREAESLSQSERDWADVRDRLNKGDDPEPVVAKQKSYYREFADKLIARIREGTEDDPPPSAA